MKNIRGLRVFQYDSSDPLCNLAIAVIGEAFRALRSEERKYMAGKVLTQKGNEKEKRDAISFIESEEFEDWACMAKVSSCQLRRYARRLCHD